jgi:hypothetical protein
MTNREKVLQARALLVEVLRDEYTPVNPFARVLAARAQLDAALCYILDPGDPDELKAGQR